MPVTIIEPICDSCKHLLGQRRCLAFKDGIPAAIRSMKHDHHEPYEGDGGVVFEAIRVKERNENKPSRNPPPKDDEPAKGEIAKLANSIEKLAENIQQPAVTVIQEAARPVRKNVIRDDDGRLVGVVEEPIEEGNEQ